MRSDKNFQEIVEIIKNHPCTYAKIIFAKNNADIRAAKQSGRKVPPLLDEATFNNRDKIREYLRSAYKYTY